MNSAALIQDIGRLESSPDRPRPVVLPTCNGVRRHPNLTALLALLLRRYGIPVLVHGPASAGKFASVAAGEAGDADEPGAARRGRITTLVVLGQLGIEPAGSLAQAQASLDRDRIAYVPAAVLTPGLPRLLGNRARPGVRPPLHSLAELIDPFGGDAYRVVSVAHSDSLRRMREFFTATRANAMLLRGTEGEPFANPRRMPRLEHFANGVATVCAEAEAGTLDAVPRLPATIDAAATAAWIVQALAGEVPVPQSIIAQLGCCLAGTRRALLM